MIVIQTGQGGKTLDKSHVQHSPEGFKSFRLRDYNFSAMSNNYNEIKYNFISNGNIHL